MKYLDGQEVRFGDEILADEYKGVVVYVIDTGEGSEKYPAGSWDYLKTGMMVEDDSVGIDPLSRTLRKHGFS